MAYDDTANSGTGWKEKLIKYGGIVLIFVLIIWAFSIANGAQDLAKENKDTIEVPEYQINHVAGGPIRFSSEFEDVENRDKIETDQYLWSSVIVKNTGRKAGENVDIEITAAVPIKKVLVSPPGYYNDSSIDHDTDSKTATVEIEEFDTGDTGIVFVGMQPENFSKPYNKDKSRKWALEYGTYMQKVVVGSYGAETSLYCPGYSTLYK